VANLEEIQKEMEKKNLAISVKYQKNQTTFSNVWKKYTMDKI